MWGGGGGGGPPRSGKSFKSMGAANFLSDLTSEGRAFSFLATLISLIQLCNIEKGSTVNSKIFTQNSGYVFGDTAT